MSEVEMASPYEAETKDDKIRAGLEYQDYVVWCLLHYLGLAVVQHVSRKYQWGVGESLTRVEIKLDRKFAEKHRLWIEVSEGREGFYKPSGIYAPDNAWLYVIGDKNTIFVFLKKTLQDIHRARKYDTFCNTFGTGYGFKLPEEEARKLAALILTPNADEKEKRVDLGLVKGDAAALSVETLAETETV
jgi:hypothetical protein